MGFSPTASTLTLTAKLTPLGKQRFVSNTSNTLITSFALGDSDANYNASNLLTTGQVPSESGEIGPNSGASNSISMTTKIKSFLIFNNSGTIQKLVEPQSSTVTIEQIPNGQVTISASNLTQNVINRADYNTDSLVNLFYSFGLPLNSTNDTRYTGTTFASGGYSDTALSGLAQSNIVSVAINSNTYGEMLDGKQIRMDFVTSAGTFNIYSTYQNKGGDSRVEDANYRDTSTVTANLGQNVAMLFCDAINTPNSNPSLSWATGFGLTKPFSLNGKQLYNLQTNTNLSQTADTVVGVAYLDKGFLVLTHPTIVSAFTSSASTATTVTFDSVSTSVSQNITCIANRGEFAKSTNPSFGVGDTPRISEVGLFDNLGNLIAMAKTDRQISKNANEFVALGIKINL
jgi:hypothetical protein